MRPNLPDGITHRIPLARITTFLSSQLFQCYIALIVISALINVLSTIIISKKNETFHFSFLLILFEVLLSGMLKLLIRSLMAFGLSEDFYLFDFEMFFDFAILAFAFLMSLNRYSLIILPAHSVILSKRSVQFLLSSLAWIISLLGSIAFFIGKCERVVLFDGSFIDECPLAQGAPNGTPAEYFLNPGLYDTADVVRDIIIHCYDVLPALAFVIYVIIAALIFKRRSVTSTSKTRSDLKTLAQGFVMLLVYGIASILNFFLNNSYVKIRVNSGALMQFLLFLYISIDVITVTAIPLSIFFVVSTLRSTPQEIVSHVVNRWRAPVRRQTITITNDAGLQNRIRPSLQFIVAQPFIHRHSR